MNDMEDCRLMFGAISEKHMQLCVIVGHNIVVGDETWKVAEAVALNDLRECMSSRCKDK